MPLQIALTTAAAKPTAATLASLHHGSSRGLLTSRLTLSMSETTIRSISNAPVGHRGAFRLPSTSALSSATLLRHNRLSPQIPLQFQQQQCRNISLSPTEKIRTQPQDDTARRTPTLFNPIYTAEDLRAVRIAHFEPENFGDRVATALMRVARWGFDMATRYKHPERFPRVKGWEQKRVTAPLYDSSSPSRPSEATLQSAREQLASSSAQDTTTTTTASETMNHQVNSSTKSQFTAEAQPQFNGEMELAEMRRKGIAMTPEQWMTRIIFLETIAGVPGLVAAACRHLQSLRVMRRDKGWIRTLLEDAENERMHLLCAMQLATPGPFMRLMILAGQGVFFNFFFLSYLFFPRIAHRFVGKLEEEAVGTYTNILSDLHQGRLPEWDDLSAPQLAKEYWRMGPNAKMGDMIYAIRADEASHRYIHNTLASLDQKQDYNPFANLMPPPAMRGASAGLSREEARKWAEKAAEEAAREWQDPQARKMESIETVKAEPKATPGSATKQAQA